MSYPIIGDSTVLHSPPAKNKRGPVAQLGARTVRIRKVEGSIPFGSTKNATLFSKLRFLFFINTNNPFWWTLISIAYIFSAQLSCKVNVLYTFATISQHSSPFYNIPHDFLN